MYTFDQSGVSKQIQILDDGIKNINPTKFIKYGKQITGSISKE